MNENRKLNALIDSMDSKLRTVENRAKNNSQDDTDRYESGAPRVFQGSVDVQKILRKNPPWNSNDLSELEKRLGGETLFTKSLAFQAKHPEAFLQLGTEHNYQIVLDALREGHERREEIERQKMRKNIQEASSVVDDGNFVFDDE